MEMTTLIQTLLLCLVHGILWGVVINSKPYLLLLKFLRQDTSELLNCALCSGYWFGIFMLWFTGTLPAFESFIFAGVSAYTSEMVTRKLQTIEL